MVDFLITEAASLELPRYLATDSAQKKGLVPTSLASQTVYYGCMKKVVEGRCAAIAERDEDSRREDDLYVCAYHDKYIACFGIH